MLREGPRIGDRARTLLLAAVAAYAALVLLAPLLALAARIAACDLARARAALLAPNALSALGNSLVLALLAVLLNGALGLAGALVVVRQRFRGRQVVDLLFELPLAVSPVMTGLGFILVFGRGGLLTPLVDALGWKVTFAFPGLVLGTLFVALPFTVREVAHVLVELGTGEEQAAATLGASAWQTFRRVTLPNVRRALSYAALLTGARTLGEFGAVLTIGGAISGRTETATTFVYRAIEERDPTAAYGMALVLIAASLALFALLSGRGWAGGRPA
jgi:sulfate transport system permease protein